MRNMIKTPAKTVGVAAGHGGAPLSKVQKAFNALIRQIGKKRAQLAAWDAALVPYRAKFAAELLPLYEDALDLQVRMVHELDRAAGRKELTKTERRKIALLITGLAGTLVAARDDAPMKDIYNKYSGSDYDSEEAAEMAGAKSLFENVLGLDLGEDLDLGSPEAVFERAQEKMREQQTQADARGKKSAKQIAREARQQADDLRLRQSIREVYRKLVSALHPDREPDPRERERKTGLMQRANQAYEKNDLLQMLELQLELEHIDQAAVNDIGEDRLKDYNRILREQLVELEEQILGAEDGFRAQFGISPYVEVSATAVMRNLSAEIMATRRTIREIRTDLLVFEDVRKFKTWLRNVPLPDTDDFSGIPF